MDEEGRGGGKERESFPFFSLLIIVKEMKIFAQRFMEMKLRAREKEEKRKKQFLRLYQYYRVIYCCF